MKELENLFAKICVSEKIPHHFEHNEITAIWKNKGKKSDPHDYRGIQVGSLFTKIFSIILISRINSWYNSRILDLQNGFRRGHGTTDGIYITKTTQLLAEKTNKQVYAIFVDLKAAFDHINGDWLFQSIRNRLSRDIKTSKIINLLHALYQKTIAELKNHPKLQFDIKCGVRQDGTESPILFYLYLDYVLRIFLEACWVNQIEFYTTPFRIMDIARINKLDKNYSGTVINAGTAYADDLVLFFPDNANLRNGINVLHSTFTDFGLTINTIQQNL